MKRNRKGKKTDKSSVKKVKIDVQPADPFVLCCFDIYELFLQHLNAADALRAKEVSTTWNQTIGESRKVMKKIRLQLGICHDLEVIINTRRNYSNVKISNCVPEAAKSINCSKSSQAPSPS